MARAAETTVISRGTRIQARVSGLGDVEVQGFVEGELTVTGEVVVAPEGMVSANVSAHRITVRGAVRGDLVAEESVRLEDGARVVGDVRSARVTIASGALLKGYVQTGSAVGERRAASLVDAKRPQPKPVARREEARREEPRREEPRREEPRREEARREDKERKEERPAPKPASPVRRTGVLAIAGTRDDRARKGPPPPVVPALKKGAKGSLKKKA